MPPAVVVLAVLATPNGDRTTSGRGCAEGESIGAEREGVSAEGVSIVAERAGVSAEGASIGAERAGVSAEGVSIVAEGVSKKCINTLIKLFLVFFLQFTKPPDYSVSYPGSQAV